MVTLLQQLTEWNSWKEDHLDDVIILKKNEHTLHGILLLKHRNSLFLIFNRLKIVMFYSRILYQAYNKAKKTHYSHAPHNDV